MSTGLVEKDRPGTGRTFFGHPLGLANLAGVEMWERFSYYGMRALLILFMTAPEDLGGFGWSAAKAGIILSVYLAMVYLAGVAGGWIADKFLGLRNAVLYGGIGIMAGHIALAMPCSGSGTPKRGSSIWMACSTLAPTSCPVPMSCWMPSPCASGRALTGTEARAAPQVPCCAAPWSAVTAARWTRPSYATLTCSMDATWPGV